MLTSFSENFQEPQVIQRDGHATEQLLQGRSVATGYQQLQDDPSQLNVMLAASLDTAASPWMSLSKGRDGGGRNERTGGLVGG